MKPIFNEKRIISSFIPYRRNAVGAIEYYLQKRDKHARVNPDLIGMFGGGAEGNETPEETLMREISEELEYVPTSYTYLGKYEFAKFIFNVFIQQVSSEFESEIQVREGQYGIFMTFKDTLNSKEMSPRLPTVLPDVEEFLNSK